MPRPIVDSVIVITGASTGMAGRQLWSSLEQGAQPLFSRVIYISAKNLGAALSAGSLSLLSVF